MKLDQVFELGPKVLEFEKKCQNLNLQFRTGLTTGVATGDFVNCLSLKKEEECSIVPSNVF
jgi:hypothetical protein